VKLFTFLLVLSYELIRAAVINLLHMLVIFASTWHLVCLYDDCSVELQIWNMTTHWQKISLKIIFSSACFWRKSSQHWTRFKTFASLQ